MNKLKNKKYILRGIGGLCAPWLRPCICTFLYSLFAELSC